MSTTIRTSHGTYKGRTVQSVIRRVYGRRAFFSPAMDPNDPREGMILVPAHPSYGGYNVLATLIDYDGILERDDFGEVR